MLAHVCMASSMLSHFSCVLFLQLLSQSSADVPALLAEVTQARLAATAAEATHVVAMLAADFHPGDCYSVG
jgi:hypothetical protein